MYSLILAYFFSFCVFLILLLLVPMIFELGDLLGVRLRFLVVFVLGVRGRFVIIFLLFDAGLFFVSFLIVGSAVETDVDVDIRVCFI